MTKLALRIALAMLASAACHAASPPDVLVVAQSLDDAVSFDPAEAFELSSVQACTNVYQRLLQPDPDHPAIQEAGLAVAWRPGPNPRSLVFELRPAAAFASGNDVRPEDVIFSLSRAVKLNRAPVFILNELGWTADNVDSALSKLDSRRVQITWFKAVGPALALSILSSPVASIVDQRTVLGHEVQGDSGNAWLKSHSAGSGAFKIRRYIAHEALVLDANPSSPGGAPLLKTLVLKNVAEAASRRLLVEVGDADLARDLGPDQIAALRGKADLRTVEFPSARIDYLLFNAASTANPVLANPALWQAARWLIDYDGIANQLLKGESFVHQAFLADGFPGALTATPYHLDVARARSILEQAGLGSGLSIRLGVINQPPYVEIAQSLQASFARAGIQLDIQPTLAGELYARARRRDIEAAWFYWVPDYYDANSTASAFALNREDGTKTVAWRAGWRITALSDATQAAALDQNPASRIERYQGIQADVQRDGPLVIALQSRSVVVMRANVRGYRQGLDADMVYYDRVAK